jgi:outer membrane protein assembly factor BamB
MTEQQEKIKRARQIAIIAGVFTVLVALLLVLNYVQIRKSDPIHSAAMQSLIERLSADQNNQELIKDIRYLDLLARKAYFTGLWQIRTGGVLMLLGAIVFAFALRIYYTLRFTISAPLATKESDFATRRLTRRWILFSGAGLVLLALMTSYLSVDYLQTHETVSETISTEDENIVRLDIITAEKAEIVSGDKIEREVLATATGKNSQTIENVPAKVSTEKLPAKERTPLTEASVWQHFNAFRGAWGNGVSKHTNIPGDWDGASGKNILWKTTIPVSGYNSPIIWDDMLFLSGADKLKRVVYCLNRHSGTIVWEREVNNIPGSPSTPPKTTDDTGLAAPSLTTDGTSVFAIFGTGDIIAFDFGGNRQWARNLGVPDNHYGHSSSLLTWDKKVFVQYDTHKGCKVLALDVENGKTVWETERSNGVSWASPMLAKINDKYQLILLSNPTLSGYDISSGKQLWSVNCMSGEVGTSPAYGGGLIYAANEYARMVAVDPSSGQIVWEDNNYLPEVSSPVYHDGLVYVATTYAVVACFEATTGKMVWEYDANNSFYSSPMIADGKLYVFDIKGNAYVFKPGRELKLLATPKLDDNVFATPVFANDRMYIRAGKYLYCIGAQ